ncbi:MAG: hypothetical protein ACRYGR_08295 [Janthinobacterium lividum]
MVDFLRLDYETFSELPFGSSDSVGLWRYSQDPSTEVLMAAFRLNSERTLHVDLANGEQLPAELVEALCDPEVEKWAFNAAFERVITMNTLKIPTPIKGWRCAMVLAYMRSFSGGLHDVCEQLEVPSEYQKSVFGREGINLFSKPQKITKANPHARFSRATHPEKWRQFCDYNILDVDAESYVGAKLQPYDIHQSEWDLYEIDQEINDRGMPVNMEFVRASIELAYQRKAELVAEMNALTGLSNSNSIPQLLPWLKARGYRFDDLQKMTISKELRENLTGLTEEALIAIKLRQLASRTSITKYKALARLTAEDSNLRHIFQFGGASRTNRWAGRGFNAQNVMSTPEMYDAENKGAELMLPVLEAVELRDTAAIELLAGEPMIVYSGLVRAAFQPLRKSLQLTVADLSSVETAGTAWFTGCKRLLKVFDDGRDPYKDFGQEFFKCTYEEVDKIKRKKSKPAVLGGTYGLGGGKEETHGKLAGKKTGLWGYAENMGIFLTQREAQDSVDIFRKTYHEIPGMWRVLDDVVAYVVTTGKSRRVNEHCWAWMDGDYLRIELPSGERAICYHKPKMVPRELTFVDRETGEVRKSTKLSFSYMGRVQNSRLWSRIYSWGGKLIENIIQALCRDVLALGIKQARAEGFEIVGHVHDEILCVTPISSNYFTLDLLIDCMTRGAPWLEGFPLKAAGWQGPVYMKA